MRKFAILLAVASLTLPGCATLREARTRVCDNREVARDQLERQMEEATNIEDPVKYAAVMAGLALTYAALERCPKMTLNES